MEASMSSQLTRGKLVARFWPIILVFSLVCLDVREAGANQNPTLTVVPPGDQSVDEGATLAFVIAALDADGDPVTFAHHPSSGYFPQGASFNTGTGQFSWDTTYTDAGEYLFLVTATDGRGGTAYLYVPITVRNVHVGVNQAPSIASIGDRTLDEGETLSILVGATDANQDRITYSVSDAPDGSTFRSDPTGGHFDWNADFDSAGVHEMDFVVFDGDLYATETVHLTVAEINDNPTVVLSPAGPYSVDESQTLVFQAQKSDPDGDPVSLRAFPGPPHGLPSGATFDEETGQFSWTPAAYQAGDYRFYIIAEDGRNGWARETVEISVGDFVNRPAVDPVPSLVNDPDLTLTGTKDPGAGIWVDGVERLTPTPSSIFSCQVPLSEGLNALSIVARNPSGKASDPPVSATTTLDSVPPEITEWSPEDHSTEPRPTITASYNDGSGSGIDVVSVSLVFDGVDVTSEATVASGSLSWAPSSDLVEGSHFARVEVSDVATNQASKEWTIGVEFGEEVGDPGGSVVSEDGSTTVTIPPGAIPALRGRGLEEAGNVRVYVIPLPTEMFPDSTLPDDTDLQAAVLLLTDPPEYVFASDLELILTLDDYQVPGSIIRCMLWDQDATGKFIEDPAGAKTFIVNMDGKTATASISHFSVYGALKGLVSSGAPLGGGVEIPLPDLFTGAFSHGASIEVPPGRKNLQPSLQMSYRSNNRRSQLGFGWEMNPGCIERSSKRGVPNYVDPPDADADSFVFSSTGSRMELVNLMGNLYQAQIESGFVKFFKEANGSWRAVQKDGMQLFFGQADATRIVNGSGTFRWCLDRIEDPNGNYLEIAYSKDGGDVYLDKISYTGNVNTGAVPQHEVLFTWESRDDAYHSYMSGHKITTAQRLQRIQTRVSSVDEWYYELGYDYCPDTARSLLTTLTRKARDDTPYPVQTFTYQTGGGVR